jgi:AcrR family transcriptional regulator
MQLERFNLMARSVGIDRTRIVEVAARLADINGLEHLTLAQVAAELGVRLPSLYNHIDGLPGLRRELALFGTRQLLQQLSRSVIGKSSDEAVLAFARAFRSYIREHPGCYAATVRAPAPNDLEQQQTSQAIIDVVVAVLEPYRLHPQAAIHAVRGLRSIVHGFATLEMTGGFEMPLDREESFQRLLRTYLAGLHADATP